MTAATPSLELAGALADTTAISFVIRYRLNTGPGAWVYWPEQPAATTKVVIAGQLASSTAYQMEIAQRNPRGVLSAFVAITGSPFTTGAGVATPPADRSIGAIKVAASVLGAGAIGLTVNGSGTGWTIAFDQATLVNGSGEALTFGASSLTGSMSNTAGTVDAIDTGSWHATTPTYVWAISDGTNLHTYASETLSPTLPGGYTYKARLGAVVTNSGATALQTTIQVENEASYASAPLPVMASGGAGNVNHPPTWSAVAVGNFVPATAYVIKVSFTGGSGKAAVAPNNSYDNYATGTNLPAAACDANAVMQASLLLESASIYWGNAGGAPAALICRGWIDKI